MSVDDIRRELNEVMDPEIPVVSIVEMGVVRAVEIADGSVCVTITPTFAGCPALDAMREGIREKLSGMGLDNVKVKTVLTPPWSSDWITQEARAKLKAFGVAPPPVHGGNVTLFFPEQVTCPFCNSGNTRLANSFGPTLCRAIYMCRNCHQPFEQFKAL